MTTRSIQRERQFVVIVPSAYHGGFNVGYNVAEVTNFADFSWPEVGRLVPKNKEVERPFIQCAILVDMNLWQEVRSFDFLQLESKSYPYNI